MQACKANSHGRCRNVAVEGDADGFCTLHAKQKAGGTTVNLAPRPTRVLVKANINPKWADVFARLGIPTRTQDFAKLEAEHRAEAEKIGRGPYVIRKDIVDSGVPVFGKDGLRNVLAYLFFAELMQGYRLTDMHVFQRRDRGVMNVLVLTFEEGVDGAKLKLPLDVAEFFALSKWGYCHVWANPPKPDGAIIHTVNLSHRSDEAAIGQLVFVNGLWDVEEVAS